jgi:hypothetical protein
MFCPCKHTRNWQRRRKRLEGQFLPYCHTSNVVVSVLPVTESIQLLDWLISTYPWIGATEVNMFFEVPTMLIDKFNFTITLRYTGHNSGSYSHTGNPMAIKDIGYWWSNVLFWCRQNAIRCYHSKILYT